MSDDARTRGIDRTARVVIGRAIFVSAWSGTSVPRDERGHAWDHIMSDGLRSPWTSQADAVLAALGIEPDMPLPLRIITQADDGDFRMSVCEVIDDAIYGLIDDEDSRIAQRIIPALAKAGMLAARLEEPGA